MQDSSEIRLPSRLQITKNLLKRNSLEFSVSKQDGKEFLPKIFSKQFCPALPMMIKH